MSLKNRVKKYATDIDSSHSHSRYKCPICGFSTFSIYYEKSEKWMVL